MKFFHATTISSALRIRRDGLRLNQESQFSDSRSGRIYLTSTREEAEYYGGLLSEETVILTIELPEQFELINDPQATKPSVTFYVEQDISADYID